MKLFVTCGSGLSSFFKQELNDKFDRITVSDNNQNFGDGKIFFEVGKESVENDGGVKNVKSLVENLKTVERLFGLVLHVPINPEMNLKTRRSLIAHYYQVAARKEVGEELQFWNMIKMHLVDENSHEALPPTSKRIKLDDDTIPVGFRVSAKLTQESKYLTDIREVSKTFGIAIVKALSSQGWKIKLRNPDLEIMVNISDSDILIGVPLTDKPLSERKYLTHIPLRSTICYSMASLLFKDRLPEDNELPIMILDPMCGAGTILVEIAQNFSTKTGTLFGIDKDETQLLKAQENLEKSGQVNRIHLIRADCRNVLSFQFDAIICDLPFGKQHGTVEDTKSNLKDYLFSFNKNLTQSARIVLLISDELASFLENSIGNNLDLGWKLKDKFPIRQGVLSSVIFLFEKKM